MKSSLKNAISAALMSGALIYSGATVAGHLNTVLEAHLDGRNEVATGATDRRIVGDPNGGGTAYVFGIDNDPNTLCYVLLASKIKLEGLAAHIHLGQPGENGPVVAFLAGPVGGNAADCLSEGEAGKFNLDLLGGSDAGIVQEILANPGNYYVNVHNSLYPGGAVRGQLEPQHE